MPNPNETIANAENPVNDSAKSNTAATAKAESNVPKNAWWVQSTFAFLFFISYGFLMYYIITHIDMEDKNWDRIMILLSGIEGLVFAAAGFIFGREVSRSVIYQKEKENEEQKTENKNLKTKASELEKQNQQSKQENYQLNWALEDEQKRGILMANVLRNKQSFASSSNTKNDERQPSARNSGEVDLMTFLDTYYPEK